MAKAQQQWQASPTNKKLALERSAKCASVRREHLKGVDPATYLWMRAKQNASLASVAFTLCVEDIVVPTVCPVLGIPLFFTPKKATPNTPSVDRIYAGGPYSKNNVIIISHKANMIKSYGTPEEHKQIYEFFSNLEKAITYKATDKYASA